jgi:hypothetical protein
VDAHYGEQDHPNGPESQTAAEENREREVDTEFLFGFTAGADVGEVGERAIDNRATTRLGKRDGSYIAIADQLKANLALANARPQAREWRTK